MLAKYIHKYAHACLFLVLYCFTDQYLSVFVLHLLFAIENEVLNSYRAGECPQWCVCPSQDINT